MIERYQEIMKFYKGFLALLVTMRCTQAVADMNIIKERFVNTTNIITRVPFTTITSCFMKCSAHNKCSAIGFGVDPALENNSECLLLKRVEAYGIENKEGLALVFVMIKNEEEFVTTKPVLPDCPVDGGYNDWSVFSTCSKPCNAGVQNRSRVCNNPFPRGDGANCSKLGSPTEQRTCNLTPCPIHGGWSSFGSWSSCGASCGSSTKTRYRSCSSPAPKYGGNGCTGLPSEATSCVTQCSVSDFCKSTSISSTTLHLYNSQGASTGSVTVECLHENGKHYTLFTHDAFSTRRFHKNMHYRAVSSITWQGSSTFIREAVQQFSYCVQRFNIKHYGNSAGSSSFNIWDGTELYMNQVDKCHGCNSIVNNVNNVRQGEGYVDDKNLLPFTGMQFTDNDDSLEFMEISLQKLKCR